MKQFTVHAEFDKETGIWIGSNEQIPLTTEAKSLDQLFSRVVEIAPEIVEANGHLKPGERFKIHFTTDQVVAAAS